MEENINFLIYKENIVDLYNLILNDNTCWHWQLKLTDMPSGGIK